MSCIVLYWSLTLVNKNFWRWRVQTYIMFLRIFVWPRNSGTEHLYKNHPMERVLVDGKLSLQTLWFLIWGKSLTSMKQLRDLSYIHLENISELKGSTHLKRYFYWCCHEKLFGSNIASYYLRLHIKVSFLKEFKRKKKETQIPSSNTNNNPQHTVSCSEIPCWNI